VITTAGWNAAVGDLWRTDADYFGIQTRPKCRSTNSSMRLGTSPPTWVRTIWNEILAG